MEKERVSTVKVVLEGTEDFKQELGDAEKDLRAFGTTAYRVTEIVTQLNSALKELVELRKQLL